MKNLLNKYRGITAGIVFIIIGMLFYTIMQVFDLWTPSPNQDPFCEYYEPGMFIGTPINTWSNLFYMSSGLIILALYDFIRNGKITKYNSFISKQENLHYALVYGLLVVWLGLGSFFMHGSHAGNQYVTGHFFDALSMNMFISAVFIISLAILTDMDKKHFYIVLLIDFIIAIIIVKLGKQDYFFIFFLVIAVGNEFAISLDIYHGIYTKITRGKINIRKVERSLKMLLLIGVMFASSYMFWFLGRTGAKTCDPYSWWQWHAYWHFGTAIGALLIGFYILLEKEVENGSEKRL